MKYDRLYNFISPVTGKLPIDKGYTLLGDKDGRSFVSPILIDVRQDIIDLKRQIGNFEELKKLDHNRIWIGDYDNEPIAQLNIGIINLPPLAEALFPNPASSITGDFRIPNPTFDYTSAFDWVMSGPFLPQIYATKYDIQGNPIGTDISSSLAMTQVRASQIMKRFDNADFIVGSSTVNFSWENPKMLLIPESLKQLYGLGTSYTFTKAQSLGALETGLLKNTVTNGKGTLSQAISGEDYVNTNTELTTGSLVIINPLYPAYGSKLINKSNDFNIRKNKENEFGIKEPNKINILEAPNINSEKLRVTSVPNNSVLKINETGEVSPAIPDVDYVKSNSIKEVTDKLRDVSRVVKQIIGVKETVDIAEVTKGEAEAISSTVKNVVGVDEATDLVDVSEKAADIASSSASLIEIESQIAALAGVEAIGSLATILGFVGLAATGKNYGKFIKGQTLNVKNKWFSTELNDEGHNAVGDFEFRWPSGYSSDDRGHGTLWFDSDGRELGDTSEGGLRLFSWDSGGDHLGYDSPLAPLSIGIFGYQNKYNVWPIPNPTPVYRGFIFSSEFNNDSDSDNYRFPINFGLYDAKRTIRTSGLNDKWGWDYKHPLLTYDYKNFTFYKKSYFKDIVSFEKEVEFLNVDAIKLPVGKTSERPVNKKGWFRYNDEFGIEYCDGINWVLLNNKGTVTSIDIKGTDGVEVSGSPIVDSGIINLKLSSTGVTNGNYSYPKNLTIDKQGRVTFIESGSEPLIYLTLNGSVNGNLIGNNINTTLNHIQYLNNLGLTYNCLNSSNFAEFNIEYNLEETTPTSQLSTSVSTGTSTTKRYWVNTYQPGNKDIPNGRYVISFYHYLNGVKNLVTCQYNNLKFSSTLDTDINLSNRIVVGAPNPTEPTQIVNKVYADSLVKNIPASSLANYPSDSTKYLRGDGVWAIPSGGNSQPSAIIGDIKQSIKTTDHNGWLIWQKNRVLSRTTYAALWNEVVASNLVAKGIFGNGDGSTTFTMGDIEGRHLGIAGSGTGLTSRVAGDKIGKESINEVVSHTHSISHTHSGSTDYVTHTHTMNHDHPIVTSSSNTHDHDLVTFNLNGVNSNLDTVVYQYTTQSAGNGGYIDYDASGGVTPFRAMYNVGLRKTTTVDTHNHTVDIPSFTGNTGSNLHYHGVNIDPDPTLGSGSTGVSSVNVMNPSVFFNLFIYAGS